MMRLRVTEFFTLILFSGSPHVFGHRYFHPGCFAKTKNPAISKKISFFVKKTSFGGNSAFQSCFHLNMTCRRKVGPTRVDHHRD